VHTLTRTTPAGPLTVITGDAGAVLAAGFTDDADGLARRLGLDAAPPTGTADGTDPVAEALDAYLAGDLRALDRAPVEQPGTAFQQAVWAALREVPPGQPATYGELAARIGRPGATRAVGSACGRNLVAPFIPCHRAVRADGSPGGYLYGGAVKTWLLAHESGQ
jgi:methylated-DNA-[protein]-cysteine S-methyltransferase